MRRQLAVVSRQSSVVNRQSSIQKLEKVPEDSTFRAEKKNYDDESRGFTIFYRAFTLDFTRFSLNNWYTQDSEIKFVLFAEFNPIENQIQGILCRKPVTCIYPGPISCTLLIRWE